jgi:hypothetical protein
MRKTSWVLEQVLAVVGWGLILDPGLLGMTPSAQAESLNLKPGAWETTGTTTTSGSKIPPQLADKFTPEQRAKMDEALKAHDSKPMTRTEQSCITKEDLAHDRIIKEMKDENGDRETTCTIKVLSKSSSKLVADRICQGRFAGTFHFTVEAKTAESFILTSEGKILGGGTGRSEIMGRWLGASCVGIEED